MCNANTHGTLQREGGGPSKHRERILCLIFSCLALKYKFYFIITSVQNNPYAKMIYFGVVFFCSSSTHTNSGIWNEDNFKTQQHRRH